MNESNLREGKSKAYCNNDCIMITEKRHLRTAVCNSVILFNRTNISCNNITAGEKQQRLNVKTRKQTAAAKLQQVCKK